MNIPRDNGYISDYLIHWTGGKGEDSGAKILSTIASTGRLLLSDNPLWMLDWHDGIKTKMVCFTDVPLRHSDQHCKRYGRFGIAFHKLNIMNVGAQPVFYATHACREDMNKIFRFILESGNHSSLPKDIINALYRHFYFIQSLSEGRADSREIYYYEREWRLGEQTLLPEEERTGPNAERFMIEEDYPFYNGKLVKEGDNTYFEFEENDVAFLVCPRSRKPEIHNPHGFQIWAFEDIVGPDNDKGRLNNTTQSDAHTDS